MANRKNIKYSFNECNWFELADLLLANSDELNLNLPIGLLAFLPSSPCSGYLTLCMELIFLEGNGQFYLYFSLQLFHREMLPV